MRFLHSADREQSRDDKQSYIQVRVLVGLALLCLSVVGLLAAPVPSNKPTNYPAWWFARGVIVQKDTNSPPSYPTDYPTADDYAAINQGQLKNFATQAFAELQADLPPYAWTNSYGVSLSTMVNGWNRTNGDSYAVQNLGQLKTVGAAFYNVLISVGYTNNYPWTGVGADDYSAANIGQTKNLFSFDTSLDTNSLPYWWEKEYFGSTGLNANSSPDGNGLTLLQDYQQGNNPTNYYSQGGGVITPSLTITGGNNQNSAPGAFTPLPLSVHVANANGGAAMVNAPVTFSVASGGGQVALTSGGSTSTSLLVQTGSTGNVQIYYQQPSGANISSTITASSGDQTGTFTEVAYGPPSPVSNVTAVAEINGINLSWSNPTPNGASNLFIEQLNPDGSWTIIASISGTSSSYALTGLTPGLNYTFQIVASNSYGISAGTQAAATQPLASLQITSPLTVTLAVNSAYSYPITATGSPTSYTATNLPSGLSVNATTGVISGTPTTTGVYDVPITASGSSGTSSGVLVMTVVTSLPTPVINSPTTMSATAGSAMAYRITASNSPTQYGATGLPSGLLVDPTAGVISGIPSTTGTYSIGLQASNSSGSGNGTLTLIVNSATSYSPAPAITSSNTATATLGQAFMFTITASNSPTSFTAVGLPSWLILNASSGALSGTPTVSGNYSIQIIASNSSGSSSAIFQLQVLPNTPVITSSLAVIATQNQDFDYLITANNAPTNFTAPGLPTGLTINPATGEIYGVPTASGTFTTSMTASNGASTASNTLTLTVTPDIPVIVSSLADSGVVGIAYSYTITATNYPTSYNATGLPSGLSINSTTGLISGTPESTGTFPILLSATNPDGTGTATMTLAISAAPVWNVPAALYTKSGSAFNYSLASVVLGSPTSYAVTGLPATLTYNPSTESITGTTTAVTSGATYTLGLSATNPAGTTTTQVVLSVGSSTNSVTLTQSFQDGANWNGISNPSATIIGADPNNSNAINSTDADYGYAPNSGNLYVGSNAGVVTRMLMGFDLSSMPGDASVSNASLVLVLTDTSTSPTDTLELYEMQSPLPPFQTSDPDYSYENADYWAFSATWAANSSASGSSLSAAALTSPSATTMTWTQPSGSTNLTSAIQGAAQNYTPLGLMLVDPAQEANPSGVYYGFDDGSALISPESNGPVLTVTYSTASPPVILPIPDQVVLASSVVNIPVQFFAFGSTNISISVDPPLPSLTFNSSTGVIGNSGTLSPGEYAVTLSGTNANGTGSTTFNLSVGNVPTITSPSTLSGTADSNFSTSGNPTYSITASNGGNIVITGLPPGLSYDSESGTFTGTPTAPGTYTVTITSTNAFGTSTQTLIISVANTGPSFDGPYVFNENQGVPVSTTVGSGFEGTSISTDNSTDTLTVTFSSSDLPPGISLSTAGGDFGEFTGTPTTTGTYTSHITATDSSGAATTVPVTFNIAATPVPQIETGGGTGLVGSYFSASPSVTWFPPFGADGSSGSAYPYYPSATALTWSATGLPSGWSINSVSGAISTQNPVTTSGAFNVTVTATSAYGAASTSASLPITIFASGPAITTPLYAAGSVGEAFNYTLQGQESGATITSTQATGLPPGLTFQNSGSSGTISGVPMSSGTYQVKVSVTDSSSITNSTTLIIAVNSYTAMAQVGQAFSYAIPFTGNPTGYYAANLPAGLSINPTTGVISGMPLAANVLPINVGVTGGDGTTQLALLQLIITAAATDASISLQDSNSPDSSYSAPCGMIVSDSQNPSSQSQVCDTGTVLTVGNTTSTALSRALINFDLSAIPPGAVITSAELVMNSLNGNSSGVPLSSGSSLSVEVHQASSSYNATTADWLNSSGYNANLLASSVVTPSSASGTITFYGTAAFTTAVQLACQNATPLSLTLLAPADETAVQGGYATSADYVSFATRAGNPTQNPQLVVTFTTPIPVITSSGTVSGIAGQSFTYNITATSNPTSYTIDPTTQLPVNLTLNPLTGVISGTPATPGITSCNVSATNAAGTSTKTVTFHIDNSTPATSLSIISGNNQNGLPDTFLTAPLKVQTATASGPLPNALVTFTATPGFGLLGTTPTGSPPPRSSLTVATDANGYASAYLQLPSGYGPVTITATSGTAPAAIFTENCVAVIPPSGGDVAQGSSLPILSVVSGEGQSGPSGQALPLPFVIRATNRLGQPIPSLALTCTVSGGGEISTASTGGFGSPLAVSTNSSGEATIFLEPAGVNGTINTVSCAAGSVLGETPTVYLTAVTQSAGGSPSSGGTADIQADPDPTPLSNLATANTNTFTAPDGTKFPDQTKVSLTWNPTTVPGAFYIVQRRQGSTGTWTTLGTTYSTSYTDQHLLAGISYYYQVFDTVDGTHQLSTIGPLLYEVPLVNYISEPPDGLHSQTVDVGSGGNFVAIPSITSFYNVFFVCNPAINQNVTTTEYPLGQFDIPGVQNVFSPVVVSAAQSSTQFGLPDALEILQAPTVGCNGFDAGGALDTLYSSRQGTVTQYTTLPTANSPALNTAGFLVYSGPYLVNSKVKVTWNQTSSFIVKDINGNVVSSPVTLNRYNPSQFFTNSAYYVVADPTHASSGDAITFNWTATANPWETTCAQGQFSFVYTPTPTDLSMSFDEAAGPKYRKVALNGLPLPDEKPQQTGETDQEQEESYIDALTVGLHHSTTDVYLPVSGSDFSVSARRDYRSEVFNWRNGLRPHEQPDQPFGVCWSSNLAPNIHFIQSNDPQKSQPDEAIVTDETGAEHTFIMWYRGGNLSQPVFFPMPTAKNEQQTPNLETLTGNGGTYTFTKKYGSTLTYQKTPLVLSVDEDRQAGSKYSSAHSYARLIQAVDRLGNTINYTFANATNLVPQTINVANQPDTKLRIAQNAQGLITAMWDANGNETQFTYAALTSGDTQAYELTKVTTADSKVTNYGYEIQSETDLMPKAPTALANIYWHVDLSSITDPNGDQYQFSYAMDHSKLNYMNNLQIPFTGYYPQCGQPCDVTNVVMPDGTSSTWVNNSNISITADPSTGNPVLTGTRQNKVTDANNFTRTYSFTNAKVFPLPELKTLYTSGSISDSKIICYQTTQIDYGARGGTAYLGTEQFTFDPNAAMALSKTVDLSGNTTTFVHGDSWIAPSDYVSILTNFASASLNGNYGDPTQQVDALTGTKTFSYYSGNRIMQSSTDENGNETYNDIDSLGRRTSEKIYNSTHTLVQETDFTYGNASYPGFMTKKCVKALGGSDPSWVKPMVTQFVPDPDGHVAQEIVDPGGLSLTTSYTYDANGNKLTATDPNGNTTWFTYDSRNRLTAVTNADGSQKQMSYDARGNKTADTDENGHATLYAYDKLNRLLTQTRKMNGNGADLVTVYTYDKVNDKLTTTDPNGHTTTMAYDNLQRVTSITDALGYQTSFVYGANSGGNAFDSSSFKPTQTTDPRGYVTKVTYDALYRPTIKSVQYNTGGGFATINTQYDPVGNPTRTTDPLGHQTTSTYDALNRPTQVQFADGSTVQTLYTSTGLKWQVTDENHNATQTQYDAAGRAVAVVQPSVPLNDGSGNSANPTTKTNYDAAGNAIATINPLGYEWDTVYDARNRKVQELDPPASSGAARPISLIQYDAVGNVTAKTDALGNTTTMVYDPDNRVTDVNQPSVTLNGNSFVPNTHSTYDADGNVLTVTDPNSHTVTNVYDALNRLVKSTDALGYTVANTYDSVGNKLSVTDGKYQTTSFVYDGLNRLLATTDPAGHATKLVYDAMNKTQRTDALGQVTSYLYDTRNRLLSIVYASGDTAHNSQRNYVYDLHGNLLSVTEPTKAIANVAYTYDNMNRVTAETSGGETHNYYLDLAGNRLKTVYGGTSRTIVSTYDELNRLNTMTESGRTTSYAYDLNSNIATKTAPNGDTENYTYDPLNRCTDETSKTGAASLLFAYGYSYDLVGNVTSVDETYPSGLADRTVTNSYDADNRLTQEAVSAAVNVTTTYSYDAANNRIGQVIVGGSGAGSTTYSYNNLNQLTSWILGGATTSYTYDADGNRLTRTQGGATDTYSYDFENRLIGLVKDTTGGSGTYAYQYDYRTRRILRDESQANGVVTQVVFSGGTSVQEYTVAGTDPTLVVEYIRGSDYGGGVGGILYTLRGGTPSYTHENKRGDVVAKTDGSGALTYQAQYEGFGKQTATTGSTLDRQKSNSKDTDPTGLVDEGFRYRDLETGMFINRDPAGFVDGPNLYAYVVQNPWTHFDPEGLKFDDQQFDSNTNHMKKRVLNETEVNGKKYPTGNYQQYQRDKAYNEQVDKFNDALDKMRSTPSGSAEYDKLKSSKETVEITLTNDSETSHVDNGTTHLTFNTREGVSPEEPFVNLAHEMFHVTQNINLMEGKQPAMPTRTPGMSDADFQKQVANYYQQEAKTAAGGGPEYSDTDDYTHQFDPSKNYWVEQQAVRAQNIVSAEYYSAQDPSGKTTPQSLINDPRGYILQSYSHIDPEDHIPGSGYPSVANNPYGTYQFSKNPPQP